MGKKKGLADDLFNTLVLLPWWIGPVFAGVTYSFLRFLIPGLLSGSASNPLAMLLWRLAPAGSILVLIVWLAAEFKKFTDRRRLDRTGGLADVRAMSWREFEALVGEAYWRQGYVVEQTGSASGDGGIDLLMHRDGQKTLVQCKHWRTRRLGVKIVRELAGTMQDASAARGIVVCYGTFTVEAEAFARRNHVALVGGTELVRMIAAVRKGGDSLAGGQNRPLETPTEAALEPTESSAPPCPSCGTPMVMRTARRGPQAGQSFWGCPRFPQCRGTRPLGAGYALSDRPHLT